MKKKGDNPMSDAIRAIGKVTFLEVMREKVLYNVLVAALLLFGVGFLASRFAFNQPDRLILNFGLSALNFSSTMLAVLVGAGLLGKELERRTLYVALSHPISSFHFIFGKYWGLVQVLVLNWLLLLSAYCLLLFLGGYFAGGSLPFTFGAAVYCALLQSFVVGAVAVFFSSFSTTSLSVILTLGLYLVGINNSELRLTATRLSSPFGRALLNGVTTALPNFEHFNLGMKLTYDLPVSGQFLAFGTLYGAVLALFCLILSGVFLRVKAG